MRKRSFQHSPDLISTADLSRRIGINADSISSAFRDGRLDGSYIDGHVYVKDIGDNAFRKAMPRAVLEQECYDRWMYSHDIRSMGERAVRETA